MESLAWLEVPRCPLAREVQTLTNGFIRLYVTIKEGVLEYVEAKSTFFEKINDREFERKKLNNLRKRELQGEAKETILREDGVLSI